MSAVVNGVEGLLKVGTVESEVARLACSSEVSIGKAGEEHQQEGIEEADDKDLERKRRLLGREILDIGQELSDSAVRAHVTAGQDHAKEEEN